MAFGAELLILVFCRGAPARPSIIRPMFLKAGALSLALLLASRLLGLARESAQAAAFGTSGMADVVVLMLTLPDWLAGVVAGGALAYVMVPAWAGQGRTQVAASQRRVAHWLLGGGAVLALGLAAFRQPALGWLAAGLSPVMQPIATTALVWSALALPAALLASLWATRLQHERDFGGLYAANLVVNAVLIASIVLVGLDPGVAREAAVTWLGLGLAAAMVLRLAWLWQRQRRVHEAPAPAASAGAVTADLPPVPIWLWAALSAGLPLALPFVARSIASQAGEGGLATFNYAWKLVELPLLLAIQLVASLAFPAIARAFAMGGADGAQGKATAVVRKAFALAWTLACAAAAGLLVGAPAVAELLFGWGRMDAQALVRIAEWGTVASWGLLPQALIAVALAVLAAQARLKPAVAAYATALLLLLGAAAWGITDGVALMQLLNALFVLVATATLVAMRPSGARWLPWRTLGAALVSLLVVWALLRVGGAIPAALGMAGGLLAAALAATWVLAATWLASSELRQALRR